MLTGCPLSGVLFNFAIDPLLWKLSLLVVVPDIGSILACADDIAAAMRRLESLKALYILFKEFQVVSGLGLHPGKCNLILTSVQVNQQTEEVVRRWLRGNIPEWENIVISNVGTYLGVALGPAARPLVWKDAVAKFKLRAREINRGSLPASMAIRAYNSKAASVLGVCGPVL